jgi:NAD(P)-dependent dehydrogenase (short-subunit alcohol dehydrogenase family)
MEFENCVAVITGASSGIGKAITHMLASRGCALVIIGRNKDNLETVKRQLQKHTSKITIHSCDVTSSFQVKRTFAAIKKEFGQIDFLVNNAAVNSVKTITHISEKDFDDEVSTVLKGTFLCTMSAFPLMKKGGVIVNIGSVRGIIGSAATSLAYAAAKAGVHNLTKSFAIQLAPYAIRVNAIAPGPVYPTGMNSHWPKEKLEETKKQTLLKQLPAPEDIANSVYFLLSHLSAHITGHILEVTDGYKME